MATYQKIKGTQDFYGTHAKKMQFVEDHIRPIAEGFGFSEMKTPTFENTEVFARSVGDESDIVSKEMYTFMDRGHRSITLRPEGTASVVRAYVENKLYGNGNYISKYYYVGPMFRYERPQAGRYREFHQFGVEALGQGSYLLDADVIVSAHRIFEHLGIHNVVLKINSIGDFDSRHQYQIALKEYFSDKLDSLCPDCHRRFEKNPMRILDCKVDRDNPVLLQAPAIKDYLNEASKTYFANVLSILDRFDIPYVVDSNLVRGLDYYTDTVFEYILSSEDELNGLAICAGGKYGGLISELGGPDLPGIGYAFGLDRIIHILDLQDGWDSIKEGIDAFIIGLDDESKLVALEVANQCRQEGLTIELDYCSTVLKTQFKTSDRLNPQYIIIIGEEERRDGMVTIKNNQTKTQERIAIARCGSWMKENR